MTENEPRIFLCHASDDKPQVRKLYHQLKAAGYHPWLDEEDIPPGADWELEIPRAIRGSDLFLACLSKASIDKTGYVQKELKMGLDVLDEMPEGKIYLIPLRLEECEVPERLRRLQRVDVFKAGGFEKLKQALDRHTPEPRSGRSWRIWINRILRLLLLLALAALLVLLVGAVAGRLSGCGWKSIRLSPATLVREKDGMVMLCVRGGTFQMGSTPAEIDAVFEDCVIEHGSGECQRSWYDDEDPQHSVTLNAFWIDSTEVSNAQFERFVQATDHRTDAEKEGTGWVYGDGYGQPSKVDGADWQHPNGPESSIADRTDHPVVQVSWNEARIYCLWAGGRLPTEAEWEYAARGSDGHIYPWGNNPPDDGPLNYNWQVGDTTAVGSYPDGASWVGAMDMAGNVWEWVNDWYADDYYTVSPAANPTGPAKADGKVLRGGSWGDFPPNVRSARRNWNDPIHRNNITGFRCMVELEN